MYLQPSGKLIQPVACVARRRHRPIYLEIYQERKTYGSLGPTAQGCELGRCLSEIVAYYIGHRSGLPSKCGRLEARIGWNYTGIVGSFPALLAWSHPRACELAVFLAFTRQLARGVGTSLPASLVESLKRAASAYPTLIVMLKK